VDPGPPVIRLAVFGKPVAQSLSPRIHGLFARQLGLRVDYRAIEATPATFPDQVKQLVAAGGRGCNITVPLKRTGWELAGESSPRAQRAEAANTLLFDDQGNIFADNTDGQGLVNDLLSLPNARVKGASVCLLGAGGAAAGVLGALLDAQPQGVVVANRTVARAQALAERHRDLGDVQICQSADIAQRAPFDLFINATSLGHRGAAPALLAEWIAPGGLCYDLNYGAAALPLQQACEARNIAYVDGLGMLVNQAALSFELWTGRTPDPGAVLDELRS
jgi:shikimate dehydrogenase